MRNNEYREKLEQNIDSAIRILSANNNEINNSRLRLAKSMLREYDRLHPETIRVEKVEIKLLPTYGFGNRVYDNVSGCNITVIDNVLSIELK